MFLLSASKVHLNVVQKETVTSGASNVFLAEFEFNDDWEGLSKTVVFQSGDDKISVLLDESNQCQIPWEVLENPRRILEVGVYGTKDETIVLPTIWAPIGQIKEGVSLGSNSKPPTPDVYSQILEKAKSAADIAQSVRDDANAGKFDGPPGPPGVGVPPFTSADNGKVLGIEDGITTWVPQTGGGGGYRIGHGLLLDRETNTLSVNAVSDFEGDNTLPITAAAVQDTVGNIEILLGTI
jgi:hypothetical protein